jgi:hypothetical protein
MGRNGNNRVVQTKNNLLSNGGIFFMPSAPSMRLENNQTSFLMPMRQKT